VETPLFVYRAQKRKISGSFDFTERNLHLLYAKLSKAIAEIKNEAPVADAEKFIKGLMNS